MALHDPSSERRERVLETATREFARRGYEHASLNSIIRACGMSKSSFYHFFDSKAALFETVVTEAMRLLGREIDVPAPRELAGPHFWEHVTRLVTELLELAGRGSWFAEAGKLFYSADSPVEHSPALRGAISSVRDWLDEALEVGRECGAVRDDLPSSLQASLVFAALRCLDDWSLHHLHEYSERERERIARAQLETLYRMLAREPGTAGNR
ncbi:TetR/AcrR family transcriptional regulator [Actinopolyspora erythraea]|uniref:TetR family transcriptional regulator n=1 Tax=Actinopolyspora erythraea TaxID=414996 RepID=A0A099D7A2_9ACTN|nr:TetR/AcrR family transcriptional regulator [Actinopolyspora erythraea]ASU78930.1 TetR/AcrR family transcriptional regulator [Actinopolyspora erythraea]KGI81270.1 TetR family transcriptional regulator [Actinopolyspora erythraea]